MYQFKPGQWVENEVQRIADKQLEIAIAELPRIGDPNSDQAVHEARRHLKKIRALIRLMRLDPKDAYRTTDRRLRAVSRQLARIADSESVVGTFQRLTERYPNELSGETIETVQRVLAANRQAANRQALENAVMQSGLPVLQRERKRVQRWRIRNGGPRAIAAGLEKSIRRARRQMRRATATPTLNNMHRWRRRVKDLWLHVRLLQARCEGHLQPLQERLAALDECLGEYHNCALLIQALTVVDMLGPHEAAQVVRLLRRYQRRLRREAIGLGEVIFSEPPRRLARRVRDLWKESSRSAVGISADGAMRLMNDHQVA
jgi:hypothetical protein